jgi:hypothetical protein
MGVTSPNRFTTGFHRHLGLNPSGASGQAGLCHERPAEPLLQLMDSRPATSHGQPRRGVVTFWHAGGFLVFRKALSLLPAAMFLQVLSTLSAQVPAPDSDATLRINSRAVLVDVIVTDQGGNPVK